MDKKKRRNEKEKKVSDEMERSTVLLNRAKEEKQWSNDLKASGRGGG
jgi:hypothetical protein